MRYRILKNWVSILLLFIALSLGIATPIERSDRHFDTAAIENFQEDSAFDYSKDYRATESLMSRIVASIMNFLARIFGNPGIQWLAPWVFRALLILLVITVILILVRLRYGPILIRRGKEISTTPFLSTDEETTDYDALIKSSQERGEYKLVVRYIFLKTLTELSGKKIIRLVDWKAPVDYGRDVPVEKRDDFLSLVDAFETTWYGDYDASNEMISDCLNLNKRLVRE